MIYSRPPSSSSSSSSSSLPTLLFSVDGVTPILLPGGTDGAREVKRFPEEHRFFRQINFFVTDTLAGRKPLPLQRNAFSPGNTVVRAQDLPVMLNLANDAKRIQRERERERERENFV